MNLRHFVLGAAGAVGMVAFAAAAQATPLAGAGSQFAATAPSTSYVEKAAYRCRWHKGHRVCRRVSKKYDTYAFSGASAETLRAAASGVPTP